MHIDLYVYLPPHRETGPRCPVDNTRVSNHQLFKDNFAKREVLSLNVKCSAEDVGCSWHGELRNLEVCRFNAYNRVCMHWNPLRSSLGWQSCNMHTVCIC